MDRSTTTGPGDHTVSEELMSDLGEAFPGVRWEHSGEGRAIGRCGNGLIIAVSRDDEGYGDTSVSTSLDEVPLSLLEDEYGGWGTRPCMSSSPIRTVIMDEVGNAVFSGIVRGEIPLQSLTQFDSWVQKSLLLELKTRRNRAQQRISEAREVIAELEPRLQKVEEALAILNKHAVDCPVKHKNSTRETT